MKFLSLTACVAAALMLAGCATTPKANVLRFHQAQPVSPGSIYLRPANAEAIGALEFRAQADAVGAQLQAHGFTPTTSPQVALYNATIQLNVAERMGAPRQSGLSIGLGGGFTSGGVGLGSSVSVPVGSKTRTDIATTTTLSVVITRSQDNRPVWEGRASLDTEAGGLQGTALTAILAKTMFADFPGESGKTVLVPIRP